MGASAANNLCNPSSAAIIGAFSLVASRSYAAAAPPPTPRLRPAPPLGRARRPEASRPEDPGSRPVPRADAPDARRRRRARGAGWRIDRRRAPPTETRPRAARADDGGGGSNAGPPTTPAPEPKPPARSTAAERCTAARVAGVNTRDTSASCIAHQDANGSDERRGIRRRGTLRDVPVFSVVFPVVSVSTQTVQRVVYFRGEGVVRESDEPVRLLRRGGPHDVALRAVRHREKREGSFGEEPLIRDVMGRVRVDRADGGFEAVVPARGAKVGGPSWRARTARGRPRRRSDARGRFGRAGASTRASGSPAKSASASAPGRSPRRSRAREAGGDADAETLGRLREGGVHDAVLDDVPELRRANLRGVVANVARSARVPHPHGDEGARASGRDAIPRADVAKKAGGGRGERADARLGLVGEGIQPRRRGERRAVREKHGQVRRARGGAERARQRGAHDPSAHDAHVHDVVRLGRGGGRETTTRRRARRNPAKRNARERAARHVDGEGIVERQPRDATSEAPKPRTARDDYRTQPRACDADVLTTTSFFDLHK